MNSTTYNTPTILKWREEMTLTQKIIITLLAACITGIAAQIKIPLPFTPVPITGQSFAVLMAGVLLGRNWGSLSQIIYGVLGAAGLPWFSGMTGGLAVITGPTGGYIAGFVLAAFFLGYVSEKSLIQKSFVWLLTAMFFANFVLIFLPGLLHLGLCLHVVKGESPSIMELLSLGFFPFLLGGVIKTFLAAGLTKLMLRK